MVSRQGHLRTLNWDDLEYLARALANGVCTRAPFCCTYVPGGTYTDFLFGQTPVAHASGHACWLWLSQMSPLYFTHRHLAASLRHRARSFLAKVDEPAWGYVDGFIVAKSLEMKSNAGSSTAWELFPGLLCMPEHRTAAPVCSTSRMTCSDRLQARAYAQAAKGEMRKRRMQQKCVRHVVYVQGEYDTLSANCEWPLYRMKDIGIPAVMRLSWMLGVGVLSEDSLRDIQCYVRMY